jgi:hypothetical protein
VHWSQANLLLVEHFIEYPLLHRGMEIWVPYLRRIPWLQIRVLHPHGDVIMLAPLVNLGGTKFCILGCL